MLIDQRQVGIFTVKTFVLDEQRNPRDCFEDEPIDDLIEGIESGKYVWFVAKVTAECEGVELASMFLGANCYESFQHFANGKDCHESMIQSVIDDASIKLAKMMKKVSEIHPKVCIKVP